MNDWVTPLKRLYDAAVTRYGGGDRDLGGWFDAGEREFLRSIGVRPIYLYDYAEDYVGDGRPDWETALLMLAVRREVFLFRQGGRWVESTIEAEDLPPKKEAVDGIEWLPRIMVKARAFVEGIDTPGIMYCCGGDRSFLARSEIHPADFLRVVADARGDEAAVIRYVKSGAARQVVPK